MKVVAVWSGGKDSYFAYYKALREGLEVVHLLTFMQGINPCREGGEYNTVVTDGPVFKKNIKLMETKKISREGNGHLEIMRFDVAPRSKVEEKSDHVERN